MHKSEDTVRLEEVLRRSAFFAPSIGLMLRGCAVYGLAPLSEIVSKDGILSEMEKQATFPTSRHRDLISRTLVFYDHTPQKVVETLQTLDGSIFTPKIICSEGDAKKITAVNKAMNSKLLQSPHFLVTDTLLIVYCGSFSDKKLGDIRSYLRDFPDEQASLTREISSQISSARFIKNHGSVGKNSFHIAKYAPEEKSLFQRFLDTALYMERSELLTSGEKRLRAIFTVLLFPTIVAPLVALVMACGHIEGSKYAESNLTRWQYLQYERRKQKTSSLHSVVFSSELETLPQKKTITAVLQANNLKDRYGTTTDVGNKTSLRHVLFAFASTSYMTKKQTVSQVAFFTAMTLIFFGGLLFFITSSTNAFYSLLLSGSGMSLALGVLLANKARTECICAAVTTLVFVLGFWSVNITRSRSLTMHGLGSAISLVSLFSTCIFVTAVCIENLILHVRKDKTIADKLELSISSYLEVKPLLERELEKNVDKNLLTHSCLNALKEGGCDVSSFFEDTNSQNVCGLPPNDMDVSCPCREITM